MNQSIHQTINIDQLNKIDKKKERIAKILFHMNQFEDF